MSCALEDVVLDGRGRSLITSMRPVLEWAQAQKGVRIDPLELPVVLSLSTLESILLDRILSVPGLPGELRMVDLDGMPEDVFGGVANFLAGTPAWYGQRAAQTPAHRLVLEQHAYVLSAAKPYLSELLV